MGSLGSSMDHVTSVDSVLSALTLEDKVRLLSGSNMWETQAIERLGIPSIKTTDGPAGVRGAKWVDGTATTLIPCGISMAATFDPALVEQTAQVLGSEAQAKGSSALLAPTLNMSRSPLGGRNFENFGEDPLLTGIMGAAVVRGVQSRRGVGACIKHFVANDMETRRYNMDEAIDDRTLREVYLWPFEMALRADPWLVMTSYQKINGEHVDVSPRLVRDILRREWGFDGVVVSDWGGCNDVVGSLVATMDLEMPGPPVRRGNALVKAVKAGRVDEREHIDPCVRRMLELVRKARGPLGHTPDLPAPGLIRPDSPCPDSTTSGQETAKDNQDLRRRALDAAAAGLVLLKNDGPVLPLKPGLRSVAVVGRHAVNPTAGGAGSAAVNPYYVTTPLESLTDQLKARDPDVSIRYAPGLPGSRVPPLLGDRIVSPGRLRVDFYAGYELAGPVVATTYWRDSNIYLMSEGDVPAPLVGTPFSYRVRGVISATSTGTHLFGLVNTGHARLYMDDELVIDNHDWTEPSASFMGCASREKQARVHLVQGQEHSIRVDNVAVPPPVRDVDNTLFGTVSGLRVGLLALADEAALLHDAVDAAHTSDCTVVVVGLYADEEKEGGDRASLHLPPGTDSLIEAIAAVSTNVVVAVQSACAVAMPWSDRVSAVVQAWYQGQENGNALAECILGVRNFSGKLPVTFPRRIEHHGSHPYCPGDAVTDTQRYGEGVLVGYRHFDSTGTEPLWPFGFGLSYTTFTVSDAVVAGCLRASEPSVSVAVRALVTNTGDRDGHEVVQVYVAPSSRQPSNLTGGVYKRKLCGFQKVLVPAGKAAPVAIDLSTEAVRWFDVDSQSPGWRVDPGSYRCWVGTSSRHLVAVLEIEVLP